MEVNSFIFRKISIPPLCLNNREEGWVLSLYSMNCHPACALEVQRQSDSGAGRTDREGGAVPKAAAAVVAVVVVSDLIESLVGLDSKRDSRSEATCPGNITDNVAGRVALRMILEELILKMRVVIFLV